MALSEVIAILGDVLMNKRNGGQVVGSRMSGQDQRHLGDVNGNVTCVRPEQNQIRMVYQ